MRSKLIQYTDSIDKVFSESETWVIKLLLQSNNYSITTIDLIRKYGSHFSRSKMAMKELNRIVSRLRNHGIILYIIPKKKSKETMYDNYEDIIVKLDKITLEKYIMRMLSELGRSNTTSTDAFTYICQNCKRQYTDKEAIEYVYQCIGCNSYMVSNK